MARWSIKNYNAFVRDAMKKFDIARQEASGMYQHLKARLGRAIFAADIRNHPRMSSQAAKIAQFPAAGKAEVSGKATIKDRSAGPSYQPPGVVPAANVISSIDQWEDVYDDVEEYDYDEWVSTADTGKGKK